jgi:hypothetical protein
MLTKTLETAWEQMCDGWWGADGSGSEPDRMAHPSGCELEVTYDQDGKLSQIIEYRPMGLSAEDYEEADQMWGVIAYGSEVTDQPGQFDFSTGKFRHRIIWAVKSLRTNRRQRKGSGREPEPQRSPEGKYAEHQAYRPGVAALNRT